MSLEEGSPLSIIR